MMLTIHGLPISANYKDLKRLVKQECHITDFILDNLVTDDDGCKKVRIGVTDESDGSQLMKFLNGYHFSGHVLRVVPVGKQTQQNQSNFDTRGGYQPRNEYHVQPNNFGNQPISHNNQQPRPNTWAANTQWGQPTPVHIQQNTYGHHPQPTPVNNSYIHPQQQVRANFPPGRGPMQHQQPPHQQNFGYASKNIQEHPVPSQYEHQTPMAQGHFQGSSHAQPSPWNPQMQPVKQQFEKPTTGGFNQTVFNDHRQIPKQVPIHDSGYKDYDKGRFEPQLRGQSPGRRMSPRRKLSPEVARRMSPAGMRGQRMSSPSPQGRRMASGPEGHRMSPTGLQGRRVSPSGLQGRRMSPTGPQGRRMSPSGLQGRRMSPSGPQGRRMSPSGLQGRRTSPTGPQGRRMSPSALQGRMMSSIGPQGRRVSPSGPQNRRMSPTGPQSRRMSPTGPQSRRMSPTGPQGRRMSPTGPQSRRMSPSGLQGRRMSPSGPQGRRISPPGPHHSRRISPTMPGATDRRVSPGRAVMRMSPSRMGGRVPTGRVVTPPHGRKMSPGAMGRMSPGRRMSRMSPGRRVSPSGTHGRRMSPGMPVRRVSPQGVGRRMSPGREIPPDRRLSPVERRPPARASPPRRSPPRRPDTLASEREFYEDYDDFNNTNNYKEETTHYKYNDNINSVEDNDIYDYKEISYSDLEIMEYKSEIISVYDTDEDVSEVGVLDSRQHVLRKSQTGEARRRLKDGFGELPKKYDFARKRKLSEHNSERSSKKKYKPKARSKSGHNAAANMLNCTRVLIENSEPMDNTQKNLVHRSLVDLIIGSKKKGSGPRFHSISRRDDHLVVYCEDQLSQMWLLAKVPGLAPWPGANLTAKSACVPSKRVEVIGFIPGTETESLKDALTLIRIQNRGLNTEIWNVVEEKCVKAGRCVTFSVDKCSALALKRANYKVCVGFKVITFYAGARIERIKKL